jgi:hypothetical protein
MLPEVKSYFCKISLSVHLLWSLKRLDSIDDLGFSSGTKDKTPIMILHLFFGLVSSSYQCEQLNEYVIDHLFVNLSKTSSF